MVVISYSGKEANAKIVYYGPGLGGKTTNLEFIYDSVPASSRGKMVSMKTQTDRTLFFDFLPLDLGELGGFKTRFLLYTVPGQVFYNATRKLVLRGADAIAFVADSQIGKMEENKESLANLEENLAEYDLPLDSIPWVMQYNKRDLPEIYTIEELNRELNQRDVPYFEAVATEGAGVFETFRGLSRLLLEKLSEEIGQRMVVGRHFARKENLKQAVEALELCTPQMGGAEEQGRCTQLTSSPAPTEMSEPEPVTLELNEAEVNAQGAALEELEAIPEIPESVEPDTRQGVEPAASLSTQEAIEEAEAATDESVRLSSADVLTPRGLEETDAETVPFIVHEQERTESFFNEPGGSSLLDTEIMREEVVLSKEPAPVVEPPKAESSDAEPLRVEPAKAESSDAELSEAESLKAQSSKAEATNVESSKEEVSAEAPCPRETQPAGQAVESVEIARDEMKTQEAEEEPAFLQIIRRNHTGIFEREEAAQETAGKAQPAVLQAAAQTKTVENVIEVPVSLRQGQEEKEITLTIKLKLKPVWEVEEAKIDEFLLDGISR